VVCCQDQAEQSIVHCRGGRPTRLAGCWRCCMRPAVQRLTSNTLRLVSAAMSCAVQVPVLQQLNMYGCRRASGPQLQVVLDKLAALQWISLNGCYGITTLHLTRKRSAQVPAAHQHLSPGFCCVKYCRVGSDLTLRTWDSVWVCVLGCSASMLTSVCVCWCNCPVVCRQP
jgi:hypothetical protein